MENVIIKFVADTSGLEPAIKQLELLGKISKEDAAAFAQVNNEQKEFIQNLNKSTTEMGKLSNEVEGLMSEIQGGVMEKFAENLSEVTSETKQAGTGFKSMKAELKELKAQISSGSLGEKELKEATKRAAELQDKIGDVNDKVKALASDTKRIDAVVTAFKGIAAAASVAAGAAALFGGENEKLTKTLAQAQGAMALLQGVQELANIATTEGALKTFLLDGAQKTATISSAIMGRTIAASTAVATGGVSLLLAGLAYLIVTMGDARDTANTMNKALEGDAAARKKAVDIRIAMMKDGQVKERFLLKREYEKQTADLYEQVRTQKVSRAASQSLSLALTEKYYADLQALADKYKQIEADAAKKAAEEALKRLREATEKEAKALQDWRDKRQQIMEEMKQAAVDMEMAEVEGKINARKKDQDDFDKNLLDKMDKQKAANDKELAALMALMNKTTAEKKKAENMYVKFALTQAQVLSDTIFTINNNRLQAETDNLLSNLNTRRDAELANKDLTDAQRLQIEKRYQQEEAAIKTRAWESQKQAAIAQAAINGALAIVNILATVPGGPLNPATILSIAAATIATGAQIAIIESTKPPKFADGTEFLVGAGTGRSDSNLAYLSHGERVVPAGVNSDYFPALSAIHNREVEPSFANNILTSLANGTFDLAAQFQSKQSHTDSGLDYDRLSKVLERNKSSVHINLDEQGFNKHIIKENSKVSFRNSKLRIKQ